MTSRHRQRMQPARAPALLLSVLLSWGVSGCDGGIFGTGTQDVDATPIAGTDDSGETPPTNAAPQQEGAGQDGGDDSGAGAVEGSDSASRDTPRPLTNLTAVRGGAAVLRIAVVSGEPITVVAGESDTVLVDRVDTFSVDLQASAQSAPLRILRLESQEPFARFDPVSLVEGSVTTLLVRPLSMPGNAVVALETRIAPTDPTLALVRVVTAVDLDDGSGNGAALQLLDDTTDTTADAMALGRISYDDPATDYVVVEPGSYRLDAIGMDNVIDAGAQLMAGDVLSIYLVRSTDGESVELVRQLDSGSGGN